MLKRILIPVLYCLCQGRELGAQVLLQSPPPIANEPSMAINPLNPQQRLLGANVNLILGSEDGGQSWQTRDVKSSFGFYGDPVLLCDKKGNYYLCHLAKNSKLLWPEWFDRIVVQRSTDGGKTFNDGTGVGWTPGKVQDKPWMALDEMNRSPYKGRLYLAWTEFDRYGSKSPADSSRIRFAYSDNGGDTFSVPVVVSDTLGDCADGDNTVEGATMAVNRDGVVFLCWAARNRIYLDKSSDGGKTWGTDQIIAIQHDGWEQDFSGVMRANGMPFITADANGGIYIVWSDRMILRERNGQGTGDCDVFYRYSKNGGQDWGPLQRLNNDGSSGTDQYMPHLCADPSNGKAYVLFYDRRHSSENIFMDVYLAELKNGKMMRQVRVTNVATPPAGKEEFFGDYISVAAAGKQIGTAYTVLREGVATVETRNFRSKDLSAREAFIPQPYLDVYMEKRSEHFYIHYAYPGVKGFSLRLYRMNELVYTQGFNRPFRQEGDVLLPRNRFRKGLYEAVMESNLGKISYRFYLD
ncbi:MAG: glycoside hydrolase [Bacteroidetes bacterium]|nr:glycoside hydrolase [Bacteroidota bacterium]